MQEEPTSYELQPPGTLRGQATLPGEAAPGPDGPALATVTSLGTAHPVRPADGGAAASAEAGAGRLVGGRYRLLERLGAGGMGTV